MTGKRYFDYQESIESTESTIPFSKKLYSRLKSLHRYESNASKCVFETLPQTSQQRLDATRTDQPIDTKTHASLLGFDVEGQGTTVLYLAYGSNLCNETFRGVRGIRPLSQVNVLVPSLRLTFDLPGIPYSEPCFANTARRSADLLREDDKILDGRDYHKRRWHKGLVGVVYEVTRKDYAHIIATEGGGSAYNDVLVDCYVLPQTDTVPTTPTSKPFKAHTLFAPVLDESETVQSNDRITRPDPNYAQPSARYLKLITEGAAERQLPDEYQDYLQDIRSYTITSWKQAIGKALFLAIWMPFVILIFTLSRKMQDKSGRAPWWLSKVSAMIFAGMWLSYDGIFRHTFGDGERTVGDDTGEGQVGHRSFSMSISENYIAKEALLEGAIEAIHG